MKRIVALALAVVFSLPLAGCNFEKNAATTIESVRIGHEGAVGALTIAKCKGDISPQQFEKLMVFAKATEGLRDTAVDLLEDYNQLEEAGLLAEAGSVKKQLIAMLPKAKGRVETLRKKLKDARANYKRLKE